MKRLLLLALFASPALAGTYGVPTNLGADGSVSGTSVMPPGWLELFGTSAAGTLGDVAHEDRFFIEVTSTTLDVRIFDPGATGARDFAGSALTTVYTLINPAGGSMVTVSVGADTTTGTITDNRLVRLTPTAGFATLNSGAGTNASFSGLAPGIYELRVSTLGSAGTAGNFYGVDIRTSKADPTPYNVYTMPGGTPASGLLTGGNTGNGAPITAPVTLFPYVTRGCNATLNSFDGDGAGAPSLYDVLGSPPILGPVSGNGTSASTNIPLESTNVQNPTVNDYGMYTFTNDPGLTNAIDWRLADFSGWSASPANAPWTPVNPMRIYLPNGYAPVAGNANAVVPQEPRIGLSTAVVSGANPPVAGQTTRMVYTLSVKNPTAAALSNVLLSVGLPAGVTYVAATQACLVNGAASACTDASAAGYRRVTLASLPAGGTASLQFTVDVLPAANGLLAITGAPVAGAPPPNTTAWAQFTPNYGATAQVLGPVCQLTLNVGGGIKLPTPTRVAGLSLEGETLRFSTVFQEGVQGYRVYEVADAKGRGRHLLTERLLRASAPDTLEPQAYQVVLPQLRLPFLQVEEVGTGGRTSSAGVFPVEQARSAFARTRQLRRPTLPAPPSSQPVRRKPPGPSQFSGRGVQPLKVSVSGAGAVEVTAAELLAAGFPPLTPARLTRQGVPVPFSWSGAGSLLFTSRGLATQYTGADAYVLMPYDGAVLPPAVTLTQQDPPTSTRHVELNTIYFPHAPFGRSPWLWGLLRSDMTWPPATAPDLGTFDLPGASTVSGTVTVRVLLMGRSGHHHHIDAQLNGAPLGSAEVDGQDEVQLVGSVPAAALRELGNQLTFTLTSVAVNPTDVGLGFVYLDWLEVDGLGAAPLEPLRHPALAPFRPALPAFAGVDYLIVTHGDFTTQAVDLAALKRQEGLHPAVVEVDRAYDAFSSGVVEANAVRALIAHAFEESGSLRFVLLVGDDTFDPRDFTQKHQKSFIPSLDGWDGEFGRVPSESAYADVDGDGLPDVAIGRLPVQTTADALVMVDKIGHYPLRQRTQNDLHLAVVDARGPDDDDFLARAQALGTTLGGQGRFLLVDTAAGAQAAHQAVADALAQGATTVHYFGHGSPVSWSGQSVWTTSDSQATTPAPADAIGFQWSCFAQWYQYLYGPSLGESLLLMPQGGVSATFGPSGISQPEHQAAMSAAVYREVYLRGITLGEAIRDAKRAVLLTDPQGRALVDGWNLLGDPAMMPVPRTKQLLLPYDGRQTIQETLRRPAP